MILGKVVLLPHREQCITRSCSSDSDTSHSRRTGERSTSVVTKDSLPLLPVAMNDIGYNAESTSIQRIYGYILDTVVRQLQ